MRAKDAMCSPSRLFTVNEAANVQRSWLASESYLCGYSPMHIGSFPNAVYIDVRIGTASRSDAYLERSGMPTDTKVAETVLASAQKPFLDGSQT